MRIDREGGLLKNMAHDDAGRLVAYARQAFELFECVRNFAFEFFDERLRKLKDVQAFGIKESAGLDDFGNALHAELNHFLGCISMLEKDFGNLVHADVCALGAQNYSHKHRECVGVV